jgi:hypothetical protein
MKNKQKIPDIQRVIDQINGDYLAANGNDKLQSAEEKVFLAMIEREKVLFRQLDDDGLGDIPGSIWEDLDDYLFKYISSRDIDMLLHCLGKLNEEWEGILRRFKID